MVTIVRDDGPGHGSSVDASKHPEHAEPAQVLTTLLLSQKLGVIREHDGNRTTNPAERERENQKHEIEENVSILRYVSFMLY